MSNIELDEDSRRLYTPCASLASRFSEAQLIMTCNDTCGGRFYARCCFHRKKICHESRIVYTNGACTNNGRFGAVAGIGIAFGTYQDDPEDEYPYQFSIPVDDKLDPGGKRTSQRAELLAALEGLKKICDHDEEWLADNSERREQEDEENEDYVPVVVITTDSEYVVKGMTEWLPNWKRNGMRKSNGQRPSNLDLFLELAAEVEKRERRHDCEVKFWHIDRTYNTLADRLAKRGARAAGSGVNGEDLYATSDSESSD